MNTRELRIGNWVKWIGKPCKVDLALLTTEFDDCKTEESSYVEPIELTEQMLLDNGFEFREDFLGMRCFIKYKDGDYIRVQRYTDSWGIKLYSEQSNAYFSASTIYLHEVQNLY